MAQQPLPTTTIPPITDPRSALEVAIDAARLASPIIEGKDGQLHVLTPEKMKLTALPNEDRLSRFIRAKVVVDDRASFATYANRFRVDGRSLIVADIDAGTITARLDWHHEAPDEVADAVGPAYHSVIHALRESEEMKRWNAMEGKLHPQDEFARFLEENSVNVTYPEAAQMVELARDFEATVGQTYRSSVRLDNGDRRLHFENESKARADLIIPQKFTIWVPIYEGEAAQDITALFRWKPSAGNGVVLGFVWHRLTLQKLAHFREIATAAAEDTGLPVLMGRVA